MHHWSISSSPGTAATPSPHVSKLDQFADQFSNLSKGHGSNIGASGLDQAVEADCGDEVRLGNAETVDRDLAQPATNRGRARRNEHR